MSIYLCWIFASMIFFFITFFNYFVYMGLCSGWRNQSFLNSNLKPILVYALRAIWVIQNIFDSKIKKNLALFCYKTPHNESKFSQTSNIISLRAELSLHGQICFTLNGKILGLLSKQQFCQDIRTIEEQSNLHDIKELSQKTIRFCQLYLAELNFKENSIWMDSAEGAPFTLTNIYQRRDP